MIQTIPLENVSDLDLNPGFDPHTPFFTSQRGQEAQKFARQKLERFYDSENFRKVVTFRVMSSENISFNPDCALMISHPKLGKSPVTALLISSTQETKHTLRIKARVR